MSASSLRTLGISSQITEIEMKTIIAALLSNRRLASLETSRTHPWRRIWEDPELSVIIAFFLIAMLAGLYMATHFPLPEDIYAVPMTIT
jgi:hypothetical protein